ncbi:pyrroline-5-carboxylate reductase [Mesobacillus harenae]|uniref:pyrroline-5-carboxylate reductase n=1 Tax=Mesobacillus harenae TaxID=2213203 RepID=UPI001580DCB5|nr:pyrroline-5-carboxylate reductase [Mesobacillus harenae]
MGEKQVGYIGCGKMAQAMIAGMIKSKVYKPDHIMVSALTDHTLALVKERFTIRVTRDNKEVARESDLIILAVKPGQYESILSEIKDEIGQSIIITIAVGVTLGQIENHLGREVKAVRTMPNTPSLVGEGMSAICPNQSMTAEETKDVLRLFNCFGKTETVVEKNMDLIPAISGSSPAYVYMFIEAMADGGVLQGIPRDQAYRLAAQAVLGAAKMVLDTGEHPAKLKDDVCTPGGATIEAVASLEKTGFRTSVITAMEKCTEKSSRLHNQAEKGS